MYATKIVLAEDIRTSIIEILQSRLLDAIDLTTHAKQAHWNVKGPSFIALHQLFDEIHSELDEQSDLLAERIVALGGQAIGTSRTVAAGSTIEEYPIKASNQVEHVEAFSNRLADFGGKIRQAIDRSDELGDQGSADLFTELSRAIDKSLWFVQAHTD